MKKLLIFVLVTVLVLVSISPVLAGNGNGGGGGGNGNGGSGGGNGRGNGNGRNGNSNNQQRIGTGGNGYGWQFGINVIIGVITAIDADSGLVTLTVYGGKDISLYGEEVEVKTDSSTRFLSKLSGEITAITFDQIEVDDTASVAIGSDGITDRITVGIECPNIP